MAFCPNCGTEASGRFCPNCGTDVGVTGAAGGTYTPPTPPATPLSAPGLRYPVASALAYLGWLLTGVIFLLVSPYNHDRTVRFHAFQSIFTALAMMVIGIVLGIFTGVLGTMGMWWFGMALHQLFHLSILLLWLYLMYSAYNGRKIVLPLVGPLAEKQA